MQNNVAFGETINKYITEPVIKDSKEKIRSNKVKPATTNVTLAKRRARKFPPTISNSTLYDTGKLHDSIKMTNVNVHPSFKNFGRGLKNIEMEEYGNYHQLGIGKNKKREFIDLSIKSADKASIELMKRMVRSFKRKLAK